MAESVLPKRLPLAAAQFTAANLLHPGESEANSRGGVQGPDADRARTEAYEALLIERFALFMKSTEGNHDKDVRWHIDAVLNATRPTEVSHA